MASADAPWIPRLHLFEIDDQPWFPPFLRRLAQSALTIGWTLAIPPLQTKSPATLAAGILQMKLPNFSRHTFIDFCAGGGGPTPMIERMLNEKLRQKGQDPALFVMTDLHPHVSSWQEAARGREETLQYEPASVDATNGGQIVEKWRWAGTADRKNGLGKVCRLFNLAFHHFDDDLAKRILKDTVDTSHGFAILELQDRSFASFFTILLFGVGILLLAPYFAWKWRSPATIIFTYFIPILPFVLVFDGWVSCLRTRTSDEVEALLRSCGADTEDWVVKSGQVQHLWPCAYLNWIVCHPSEN